MLKGHDCLIVTDDIYERLLYVPGPFENIANVAPELAARTVVVNGFSKAFSMTGWRSSVCSVGARRVSWLEAELREQPAALARLIEKQAGRAREIAEIFGGSDVQYVVIASRGSSSNVARYE